MLKNKLYLYGSYDSEFNIAPNLHLGVHMLNKIKTFGNDIAVINAATNERMTFQELAQQSVDIALSLAHIGVKKGDIVAICSQNRMEYIPIAFGTLLIGAVLVNVNGTCTGLSLLHRLKSAKCKVLFCPSSKYQENKDSIETFTEVETTIVLDGPVEGATHFKDFLSQHASVEDFEPTPVSGCEDVAIVLFSSGTTGMPKGVQYTHYNFLCSVQDPSTRIKDDKVVLGSVDWSNSYGIIMLFSFLELGATIVFSADPDAEQILDIIQKYKIEIIPTLPTVIAAINAVKDIAKYDTSSLRKIFVCGTICNERVLDTFKERIPTVELATHYYGLTEVGCICNSKSSKYGHRAGSVGGVRNIFVVKIVDVETREPLGPNQRGEICCKSPSMLRGYIGGEVDYMDEEGFFKTGDLGYYDEDHYVYVVDRIKDIIKYNSCTVSPSELEAVLLQHPSVHEVGVVGAPHEDLQELPTAFVVLRPGARATEQELKDFFDKNVAHNVMQLAGGVRFIDQLPRGVGLKVDRKKLRAML
ncbi:4-coumarate--CoA ligase 1-like [Vanessa cardui]|uniref:4-coumarate--CoA ligase 1-like n=1 Tax=Vanessa cardui TaxID=171605 RepID=UPI001F133C43|nr:4-coumarate--CoA ligase 1-like [Vanessa cardui]